MGLKDLFNLDPTRYFLSNSAGAFRRVRENSKPLSLGDLMRDLVAPTIPTNLPTVNPIDTESVNSFMSVFGPASAARDAHAQQAVNRFGFNGYRSLINGQWVTQSPIDVARGYIDARNIPRNYTSYPYGSSYYNDGVFWDTLQRSYDPYRSVYSSNVAAYNTTYKPQIDTYNSEVSAYKAATADFNSDVEAYNAEASKRAAEANAGLVNPDRVTKQTQEATGDVLAESDLYSDDLHNMMIDRISTQPIIDKMSTMFSSGGK